MYDTPSIQSHLKQCIFNICSTTKLVTLDRLLAAQNDMPEGTSSDQRRKALFVAQRHC